MYTERIGSGAITVECIGSDPRFDLRQQYRHTIATSEWAHTGDDIHTGGNEPDEEEASVALLSFLGACAEARDYRDRAHRGGLIEHADLFPEYVGAWAQAHAADISMRAADDE